MMNLNLNLLNMEDESTREDCQNPLPFIPLGALSQGLILYDYDFEKKKSDENSENSWDNNNEFASFSKSQQNFAVGFEYRAPEKLKENRSVIKNSILIDFEKRILRKTSILAANQKRVSFRESPRDSSSHRRSRSESKNLVYFKLELLTNEEPAVRTVETIADEKRNSVTKIPNRARIFAFKDIDPELFGTKEMAINANKPHECSIDYFLCLINDLRKRSAKFEDPIFKADFSSLFNTRRLSIIKTKRYKWKRLAELFPKKIVLFDSIDPNNLIQKDLCNFYFGAMISALAEKPHRVRKVFGKQQINDFGAYFVRVCQDGVWRHIILDDFVPVNETDEKKPAFIGPRFNDQEIEVFSILMEKAYAKIFAGYQNIEIGSVLEALHDFTGAPYLHYDLTEENNAFDIINEALTRDFIVIGSCSKDKSLQGKFESIGLVPQYSYTIISCREVEHQGRNELIVEMRNPWGWFGNDWKGKWSKDWYGWTKELIQRVGWDKTEGSFLMDFNDFQEIFTNVGIVKVHDAYNYSSDTFRHRDNAYSIRSFKIDSESAVHTYIGLTQYDKRYFRNRLENEKGGYNYSFGRVIIGRKIDFGEIEKELEEGGNFTMKINNAYIKKMNGGFGYEYIDGCCGRARDLSLELNLEKGEYYVIVMMDWAEQIFDVTLSVYSDEVISLSRVDYRKNAGILDEILGGYAFENIFPLETSIANQGYKTYKFFAKKEAMIIEGFENTCEKRLKINRSYQELHPIFRLARTYRTPSEVELVVGPERPQFVCVRFTNMDRYNIIGLDKNVLKNYGFK